ncbi:MAG: aminoglycoside 3'-phosphotransferase [Oscillospiraceae bacterium]|nr:aminoglycoside 3'-phosphotransferase [Oscillospiraceae bacterium]
MELKLVEIDVEKYPDELRPLLSSGVIYDSSCSPEARVIYIDKNDGYFLKSARKGTLEREATMTRYFQNKGLSAKVLTYVSDTEDWLLTEKVHGDDCAAAMYLENPKRLCDTIAETLMMLHSLDYSDCPIQNHTELYLAGAKKNKQMGTYDNSSFPDSFGYTSSDEAWAVVESSGKLLKTDTLLHGDYCLPNVILNDWKLSGFIDLDNAGVGDKHVDIFWAIWSLHFNLRTNEYRQRFIDAYGREKIDESMLQIVAAVEVFG